MTRNTHHPLFSAFTLLAFTFTIALHQIGFAQEMSLYERLGGYTCVE